MTCENSRVSIRLFFLVDLGENFVSPTMINVVCKILI